MFFLFTIHLYYQVTAEIDKFIYNKLREAANPSKILSSGFKVTKKDVKANFNYYYVCFIEVSYMPSYLGFFFLFSFFNKLRKFNYNNSDHKQVFLNNAKVKSQLGNRKNISENIMNGCQSNFAACLPG